MKRLLSFVIAAALIISAVLPVCAYDSEKDTIRHDITAAEIKDIKTEITDNGADITFSCISQKADNENYRKALYNLALTGYKTHERLLNSNERYLCFPIIEFLEISADGENWFYLKNLEGENISLSLYNDILPALHKNGVDLTPLTEGFTLYGRVITASENYNEKSPKVIFCYNTSDTFTMTAPSFCFIHVILPKGTETSLEITEYFPSPTTEDIILPDGLNTGTISKEGFVFDGWSLDSETTEERVNKIPAGTKAATLYSRWFTREYRINFDAKNGHSFTFGTITNKNPRKYTAGSEITIKDLESPLGYMFCGWYLTEECDGEKFTRITSDMTGDITLYAKWLTAEELMQQQNEERQQIIQQRMYGDINSDGKITAADARLILRHVVELEIQPDKIIQRANYYGTKKITSENARTTLRISVGLDDLTEVLLEYKIIK